MAPVVYFSRCNENPPRINVYVDGHKLQPPIAPPKAEVRRIVGDMLSRINPGDIEMMEIFRGPGELPGEFNDGNCGAIAIWTRSGSR